MQYESENYHIKKKSKIKNSISHEWVYGANPSIAE